MTDLAKRRTALVAYAESCLTSGDWHGLRDAAADLEVIEARIQERGETASLDTQIRGAELDLLTLRLRREVELLQSVPPKPKRKRK